jgi:hypothetical protein
MLFRHDSLGLGRMSFGAPSERTWTIRQTCVKLLVCHPRGYRQRRPAKPPQAL